MSIIGFIIYLLVLMVGGFLWGGLLGSIVAYPIYKHYESKAGTEEGFWSIYWGKPFWRSGIVCGVTFILIGSSDLAFFALILFPLLTAGLSMETEISGAIDMKKGRAYHRRALAILGFTGSVMAVLGVFFAWEVYHCFCPFCCSSSSTSGWALNAIGAQIAFAGGFVGIIGALGELVKHTKLSYLLPLGGIIALTGAGWYYFEGSGGPWGNASVGFGPYICIAGGILALVTGAILASDSLEKGFLQMQKKIKRETDRR